jgi:hypothetical protein
MSTKQANQIDQIIAYEQGELEEMEVLELFSDLIKTGLAWSLQGSYGRMAVSLIGAGRIARDGTILEQ